MEWQEEGGNKALRTADIRRCGTHLPGAGAARHHGKGEGEDEEGKPHYDMDMERKKMCVHKDLGMFIRIAEQTYLLKIDGSKQLSGAYFPLVVTLFLNYEGK